MASLDRVKALAHSAVSADEGGRLQEAVVYYKDAVTALKEMLNSQDNRTLRLSMITRMVEYMERGSEIESVLNLAAASEVQAQAQSADHAGRYAEALKLYTIAARIFLEGAKNSVQEVQPALRAQSSACASRAAEIVEHGLLTPVLPAVKELLQQSQGLDQQPQLRQEEEMEQHEKKEQTTAGAVPAPVPLSADHWEEPAPPPTAHEQTLHSQVEALPQSPQLKIPLTNLSLLSEYLRKEEGDEGMQQQDATAAAPQTAQGLISVAPENLAYNAHLTAEEKDSIDYLRRIVAVQEAIELEQAAEVRRLRGIVSQQRKTIHLLVRENHSATPRTVPGSAGKRPPMQLVPPPSIPQRLTEVHSRPLSAGGGPASAVHKRYHYSPQSGSVTYQSRDKDFINTARSGFADAKRLQKTKKKKIHRPVTRSMTKKSSAEKFSRVTAPVFGSPAGPTSPEAIAKAAAELERIRGEAHSRKVPTVTRHSSVPHLLHDTYKISRRPESSRSMSPSGASSPQNTFNIRSNSNNGHRHQSPNWKNPVPFDKYITKGNKEQANIPNIFETDANSSLAEFVNTTPLDVNRAASTAVNASMTPAGVTNTTRDRRIEEKRQEWLNDPKLPRSRLEQVSRGGQAQDLPSQEYKRTSTFPNGAQIPLLTSKCAACSQNIRANLPAAPKCVPVASTRVSPSPRHIQNSRVHRQAGTSGTHGMGTGPNFGPKAATVALARTGSFSPTGFLASPNRSRSPSPKLALKRPTSAGARAASASVENVGLVSPKRHSAYGSYIFRDTGSSSTSHHTATTIMEQSNLLEDIEQALRRG